MKPFQGFPSGGKVTYTSVPNVFFSGLLPQITDIDELRTTLHVMAALYGKKGYPRYVSFTELLGDTGLMGGLQGSEEVLRRALQMAVERGTLLNLNIEKEDVSEEIYFLNESSSRQAIERILGGTLELEGISVVKPVPVETEEPPNIYRLYEDNIGILTPMIADELRDAENIYPEDWIKDAIKEAVNQGKRKWSVVLAILQRWSTEGRSDGTYQRDTKKTGPGRYFKGKYGHMVQR